jgi:hypothetical protein
MDKEYDTIFLGKRITIPDWTEYLVQEKDGSIRALQEKPRFAEHFKVWSVLFGQSKEIVKAPGGNDFEPVCEKVNRR